MLFYLYFSKKPNNQKPKNLTIIVNANYIYMILIQETIYSSLQFYQGHVLGFMIQLILYKTVILRCRYYVY